MFGYVPSVRASFLMCWQLSIYYHILLVRKKQSTAGTVAAKICICKKPSIVHL